MLLIVFWFYEYNLKKFIHQLRVLYVNRKKSAGFLWWRFWSNLATANHLIDSHQESLGPTANLAMKNPIVSSRDDGSNLCTSSSSPGLNHSLHRKKKQNPVIFINFYMILSNMILNLSCYKNSEYFIKYNPPIFIPSIYNFSQFHPCKIFFFSILALSNISLSNSTPVNIFFPILFLNNINLFNYVLSSLCHSNS